MTFSLKVENYILWVFSMEVFSFSSIWKLVRMPLPWRLP